MVTKQKTRKPSRQLVVSGGVGAAVGPLAELALQAFHVQVPPGTAAALGGIATALAHYLQGRGRHE